MKRKVTKRKLSLVRGDPVSYNGEFKICSSSPWQVGTKWVIRLNDLIEDIPLEECKPLKYKI